ncbi:hypothetical protein NP493_434g01033 [Ridgeia piscesae]|uniref:Palmitoyltransferase n=1 Tax=Ridgeia piscesae TaxID=27915 RepID=A0AAD9NSC9_RIDPI|nr:hypothetical protein NP493_434g01033 [Ridgeia piscesae]
MLQNGADINIVDNAGWGPIQHAVQGANVRTVHYLVEVCGLSLRQLDNNASTLLHIACANRCKLVFNYLLRYQRSNITAVDADGNSALHFAARSGWVFACCRLLTLKTGQLLHIENKQGDIPYAIANKAGHVQTAKGLAYYGSLSWISPRTDLLIQWYLMLLLPVVYYANCVLTASYVSYQTQFMAGTIPIYVAFHVFVMHRFGRLGWRRHQDSEGSGMESIQPTKPRVFKKHPFVSFVIVVMMSLYSSVYYALLRIEPSACTISTMVGKDAASIKDLDGPLAEKRRFCGTCEVCVIVSVLRVGLCYHVSATYSVLVTQTDTPLKYRENWWKLLPLIVGHYVLDVINVIQFRKVCLKMPCRRLWRRQITTGSCRIF